MARPKLPEDKLKNRYWVRATRVEMSALIEKYGSLANAVKFALNPDVPIQVISVAPKQPQKPAAKPKPLAPSKPSVPARGIAPPKPAGGGLVAGLLPKVVRKACDAHEGRRGYIPNCKDCQKASGQ